MHGDFEVTILGTGSASPTKHRHPSAQLLRLNGTYILLDCGEGTQKQLFTLGLRFLKINYILITHLHGDHFFGLPGLLTSMSLQGRKEKLTICGPEKLQFAINTLLSVSDSVLQFEIEYIISPLDKKTILLEKKNFKIESVPLQHRIECTGYIISELGPERKINLSKCEEYGIPFAYFEAIKSGQNFTLENGTTISHLELTVPAVPNKSYAYISDTQFFSELAKDIHGITVLYHESTFLHALISRAQETCHSTALQAGEMAKLAQVEKLIIGHFSARYLDEQLLLEEALSVFPNTILAKEGETIRID